MQVTAWKADNKKEDSIVSSSNKIDQSPTESQEEKTLYKTVTDIIVIDGEDSDEDGKEIEENKEEMKGNEILKIMKVIYDTADRPKQFAWIKEEMITLTYAKELKCDNRYTNRSNKESEENILNGSEYN